MFQDDLLDLHDHLKSMFGAPVNLVFYKKSQISLFLNDFVGNVAGPLENSNLAPVNKINEQAKFAIRFL